MSNRAYLDKALLTVWQLRLFGRYRGDVVLVVGDDLKGAIRPLEKSLLRITPIHFPDIERSSEDALLRGAKSTLGAQSGKTFQFHKFFCFSPFFKKWNNILYIDAKMRIYAPISPILRLNCSDSIVAHSDSYPDFQRTLRDQFNFLDFPELELGLEREANLDADFFQTTMMYFDSSIIEEGSVEELVTLSRRFPNSRTNDQGIINIWSQGKNLWTRLPTARPGGGFFYDFHERAGREASDYIMLKYPKYPQKTAARSISNYAFSLFRTLENRRTRLWERASSGS